MSTQDIRWEQRLSNYNKALLKLEEAVIKVRDVFKIDEDGDIDEDEFLDDIIKEGLIQRFEYTHELAWKVMKDFLENSGNVNIFGSKDATREAFAAELIFDGDVWMDMIISRNKTSHIYNEETADDIFTRIVNQYLTEFLQFRDKMEGYRTGKQESLF
jgi:nucleotidyltransferase substrate binding protein (TIGR01987 family)